MPRTYALAYLASSSVTNKQSFITLTADEVEDSFEDVERRDGANDGHRDDESDAEQLEDEHVSMS